MVWDDVRYAARSLRRNPAFTIAVAGLLALGIGANTAIFSLVNAVLLRTLPVREPARLALVYTALPDRPASYMIPRTVYRGLRDANSVFDGYAAATFPAITLGDGHAERVSGLLV